MRRMLWTLGALLALVMTTEARASAVRLDADTLNYDPSMQKVLAQINLLNNINHPRLNAWS